MPAYCPGGVRHTGGASSIQALVWNVGTCVSILEWVGNVLARGLEGEPRKRQNVRGRVPRRGTGADRPVVAMMLGNASGAKGAKHSGVIIRPIATRNEPGELADAPAG
jgi:hypothetical protein